MRVTLAGVTKGFGAHTVLDDVTLTVGPRSRLGLVGPNGVGKSTLLRILAGLEEPDAGTVTRVPATLAAGYLPQEPDGRPGETLLAYLARRTGVADADRALQRASAALAAGDEGDAYAAGLDRFLHLGGGDLEARARTVANDLGLPVELGRPLEAMSGGERARAALAAILLARFDLFLLDEPTNDLDFDGLERLERFLDGLEAGLVVVSHDRAFLDRTVTRIAEIDPWRRRVREFAGGWSEYEARRDEARRQAYTAFEQAQQRRRELTELLSKRRTEARAQGAGLGEKSGGADRRGTHALTTKVRQAEKQLERNELPDKPFEPWELQLQLRAGERPGDLVVVLEGAVGERGSFRLGPIDLDVRPGERIAVTGHNGSGKSTLLAMLLGELPLSAGRRGVGRRTVVGTLEQQRAADPERPLLDVVRERTGLVAEDARTLLAKFGLGAEDVLRAEASLSPGERTRARLAELQARGVNLVVLDEPTNHLDLEAIEQLEAALAGYDGAAVVVSHDRRFLERIAPTRELSLDPAPAGRSSRSDR
jgi:ATPase subunit of ABC transporter with duplicated ATPase domains